MANLPSPRPLLIDSIEHLLAEHRAMDLEELLDAIKAAGHSLGEDEEGLLVDLLESDETPLIWPLQDARYVLLPALLAEQTFTHRLTDTEIEHDLLDGGETLSALFPVLADPLYGHLVNGERISVIFQPDDLPPGREDAIEAFSDASVVLPTGTLRALDVSEDDLIGWRLTSDGVAVVRVDDVSMPPADIGPRLLALLVGDPDIPAEIDEVLWQLCADDAELLRAPLPPLPELFDILGLPHEDGSVALPGFDFNTWRLDQLTGHISDKYDLEPEEALTVLALASMYDEIEELAEGYAAVADDDAGPYRDIADTTKPPAESGTSSLKDQLVPLAEPKIASAALEELRHEVSADPELLASLVEALQPILPRATRPALCWMRAKSYQDAGDTLKAQAALAEAEAIDPTWPLALIELAQYASDRGDAAGALSLLRRAGAPNDDEFVQLLQRFQAVPRPDMRRNQPCWCGSGRKYKVCHLGREQLPLEERATWLYNKAAMHLDSDLWRRQIAATAYARLRYLGPETTPEQLMAGGLVTDAVLFEGGGLEDFLAARGELLPDDERLLAQQWALNERSLWEVESVQPGKSLVLRDVRTGERVDVAERTASRALHVGMLICTHVLPAGEINVIFGGIEPIELHQRDELIALLDGGPEPADVVAFLSRRYGRPAMQNTEGEPLVICEATFRVPDPAALMAALDTAYSRVDDDEPRWHEYSATNGKEHIRAVLRLDGDKLGAETNSEARHERVIATVSALRPDVVLIGERRRDIDEIEPSEPDLDSTIDLTDPQVQEAVKQIIQQQEQVWLDEPIPALAGVRPREAAADPTRRPDLVRLLDSFPDEDEQAIAMSPRRLRKALKLD